MKTKDITYVRLAERRGGREEREKKRTGQVLIRMWINKNFFF